MLKRVILKIFSKLQKFATFHDYAQEKLVDSATRFQNGQFCWGICELGIFTTLLWNLLQKFSVSATQLENLCAWVECFRYFAVKYLVKVECLHYFAVKYLVKVEYFRCSVGESAALSEKVAFLGKWYFRIFCLGWSFVVLTPSPVFFTRATTEELSSYVVVVRRRRIHHHNIFIYYYIIYYLLLG